MSMTLSENSKEIYRWLDENKDLHQHGNTEFYKMFPNKTEQALRSQKRQWKKKTEAGIWPEGNTGKIGDSPELQNAENQIGTSIDASTSEFIAKLYKKRALVQKIIDDYERRGALSLIDIHLEKPFKTVSYSLMEQTLNEFIQTCKNLGISQRKALHIAIKEFNGRFLIKT